MQKLINAMVEMEEERFLGLTKELLDRGEDPNAIFRAYQEGMAEIGRRFEQKEFFIPELIMAGEMMNDGAELIKPYLDEDAQAEKTTLGTMVLATIEGDIHDIGKNIYGMMMELSGFEIIDLGVDVPVDDIVAKIEEVRPALLGMSGLLTLAFDPMKAVVDKLKEKGLRDSVKVMIGGGQMDQTVCDFIGADGYATDAVVGVNACKIWTC